MLLSRRGQHRLPSRMYNLVGNVTLLRLTVAAAAAAGRREEPRELRCKHD